MRKIRILIIALLAITGAIMLQALLLAQAAAPKKVPFVGNLTADLMEIDLNKNLMSYDDHVIFTSPVNNTSITCDHLKANAASKAKITSVEASGHVKFSVTTNDKATGKPNYHFDGTGELVQYSLVETTPIVHMTKVNGVTPRLTMTDLATNEPTIFTGEEIEYNLATGVIKGKMVNLQNPENGQ